MTNKVRFETSGPLGILTLANLPLNLFSGEVIEDLRDTVTESKRAPIRALLVRRQHLLRRGRGQHVPGQVPQ